MAARKLIYKLTVLAVVPVIVSMVLFGSISYTVFKDRLIQERVEEARSLIELSSDEIKNPLYFLELNKLNAIIANIKENPNVLSVYIMDPEGKVITDGTLENKFYNQFLTDNFSKKYTSSSVPSVEIRDNVLQVSEPVTIKESIGIIRIDFSLKELDQVLFNLLVLLGMIGAVIFITVAAIDISITNSISKPIIKLRNAADGIARGNFGTELDIKPGDEIGELAGAFNKMSRDLQKSSEELTSAKDYTDNILHSMMDTLIVVSEDGTIQTVNPAACSLLDYGEKELVGQHISKVLGDRDELLFNESMCSDPIKKGLARNIEKTYISKDSREIPVAFSASIMRGNDGGIQGIVCAAKDITERKQAEEMQKEIARAELYGFIVSALPVFASGVPSSVRNILIENFADRFESNVKPKFEGEMKRLEHEPKLGADSDADTKEILETFMVWLSKLFSNFGIHSTITCEGPKSCLEFSNCPWIGEAKGNPIFCFICRAIVIRTFTWTYLKGNADQNSSIANGSKTCRFEIHVNPNCHTTD